MSVYDLYESYVNHILLQNDLSSFKSHPNYTYMLEHVGFVQGQQYKQYIEQDTKFSQEDIRAFCAMNDSIGSPTQYSYDSDLTCSPTSLRYIWQAYIILTYFKHLAKETAIDIVEVGGGYGGLCLAIHTFAPQFQLSIRSYTILDLDAPNRLQEAYLSNFLLSFPVSFVRGYTYGATLPETNYYLISNYCFSEIESVHQSKYSTTLFPKVIHGFMAWNNIPLYNFGFPYQETDEVPNTGGQYNRYVYF